MATSPTPTQDDKARGGRRAAKKRETRRRILAAARSLLSERELDKMTIDDLAEAADISRPTFFNYYSTKQALLDDLTAQMYDWFDQKVEQSREIEGGLGRRIGHLFHQSADMLVKRPRLYRLLLIRGLALVGSANGHYAETRIYRNHETIRALLEDARNRGELREDLPTEMMVQCVAGTYLEALVRWAASESFELEKNLEEAAGFLGTAFSVPGGK